MISQLLFVLLLVAAFAFFARNIQHILKVIRLGKPIERFDKPAERIKTMLRVAFAQGKMVKRPVAGILHIFVYAGFVIINLEIIEIVLDGIFGTHRIMAPMMGTSYSTFIGLFEVMALLVLVACVIFLIRRNVLKIERFHLKEMSRWPKLDANIILVTEILLMAAFLSMNAADSLLVQRGAEQYIVGANNYWISMWLQPIFSSFDVSGLVLVERFAWWFHAVGILIFLNFLPYSKHLHIIFAFPNVYFSKLEPRGQTNNMACVHSEVKIMMGMEEETIVADEAEGGEVATFGAKNIKDLTWKHILDSYTCTECGRCSSKCPANITGKKLSPRKIIMDVRDRAEDVSNNIRKTGDPYSDGKDLFSYISKEELWACTTCNQCTEECPVNINHLAVILQMRRYVVMEENAAPATLNMMFTNIENNGAPWQYSQADRANWTKELFSEA